MAGAPAPAPPAPAAAAPPAPLPVVSLPKPSHDPIHFDVHGAQPIQDLLDQYGGSRSEALAFLHHLNQARKSQGPWNYEPIGAPLMYPTYQASMIAALMASPRLRRKVASIAARKLALLEPTLKAADDRDAVRARIEHGLEGVARRMAEEMAAKIESPRLIKTYGFLLQTFFARLYHLGIHVSVAEVTKLREVAAVAAKKGQSLILLPCHKSHVDYLLLSWLFWRLGLALPHIVAGENLNLPIVGPLLRRGGALYIRRSWGDDPLYPTVANEYMSTLIEKGFNLEVFLEGTRSRSGKVLSPKFGVLKVILDAVLTGRTSDVMILPISIQYDRVIEGRTYVREMLGTPKEAESLSGVLSSSSILGLKLGRIDVRFAPAYSLKGMIDEQTSRRSVDPAQPSFDVKGNEADKQTFLRQLGYRVLSDINGNVAMPSALVATALLTLRSDKGVSKKELIRRVEWIIGAIKRRGGRVADFGGLSTAAIVDRTISSLKDLIGKRSSAEVVEETVYAKKPIELSLYRNQISHVFLSECILCASLYLRIKTSSAEEFMDIQDLTTEARYLSDLLKIEFVFPLAGIDENVRNTLDLLVRDNILAVENGSSPARVRLSEKERSTGREQYDFFCFMLWPFAESYWLASVALYGLLPATPLAPGQVSWVAESDFLKMTQSLGKTLFWQGDLSNLEAISTFSLQNAFQRAQELGIVLHRKEAKRRLVALDPAWVNEDELSAWAERVGAFRREGKSRRTNALAARRVMDLAKSLALPPVETTPWPIAPPTPAADFKALPPTPARL